MSEDLFRAITKPSHGAAEALPRTAESSPRPAERGEPKFGKVLDAELAGTHGATRVSATPGKSARSTAAHDPKGERSARSHDDENGRSLIVGGKDDARSTDADGKEEEREGHEPSRDHISGEALALALATTSVVSARPTAEVPPTHVLVAAIARPAAHATPTNQPASALSDMASGGTTADVTEPMTPAIDEGPSRASLRERAGSAPVDVQAGSPGLAIPHGMTPTTMRAPDAMPAFGTAPRALPAASASPPLPAAGATALTSPPRAAPVIAPARGTPTAPAARSTRDSGVASPRPPTAATPSLSLEHPTLASTPSPTAATIALSPVDAPSTPGTTSDEPAEPRPLSASDVTAVPAPAPGPIPSTLAITSALGTAPPHVLLANAVSTTPREGLRSNVVARPRAPSADHTQAARGSEPAAAEPASLETASDIEAPAVVEVPAAGARAAAPAPVVTSEAREPAVHTAAVDTREPSPQPLLATDAPIGGTATPIDGGLANVSRPSLSSTSSERMMGVESTAVGGLRERTRAAATEASDHRVLTHGIRAEIDLGDGGHITVHAENPASRVEVKLDTDVGATARTLAQHARELAGELRTDGRDARVTVSGPGTHTTVTSSGSSAGDAGGYEASSRRESDAREPRDGRQQDEAGAERGAANGPPARVSRRARFVL